MGKKIGRAQSSIEFFVLITAAVFFFLSFSLLIQNNLVDKNFESINIQVKDTAFAVQDEINLAIGASDGYKTRFPQGHYHTNKA